MDVCVYIYIYTIGARSLGGFWAQGLVVATSSAPRDFKQWYEYSRFIDSTPFCLTSRMLVLDVEMACADAHAIRFVRVHAFTSCCWDLEKWLS